MTSSDSLYVVIEDSAQTLRLFYVNEESVLVELSANKIIRVEKHVCIAEWNAAL